MAPEIARVSSRDTKSVLDPEGHTEQLSNVDESRPHDKDVVFPFGKNWQRFLSSIGEEQIGQACQSLKSFMEVPNLADKSFVDIGCGSGLFSYAAFLLGARQIVSIDIDPFSVSCVQYLHEKAGQPSHWTIHQGSALDAKFLSELGTFDIVYSWGVLHHTGRMWQAVKNSAGLVSAKGLYYIALYNKVEGRFGSRMWMRIKRFYNVSPKPVKWLIQLLFILIRHVGRNILRLKNPFEVLRNFGAGRGMRWRSDMIDWLGGYPYEYATVEEVFAFMKKGFPLFTLINIKTEPGLGNNWFLFRNDAQAAGSGSA